MDLKTEKMTKNVLKTRTSANPNTKKEADIFYIVEGTFYKNNVYALHSEDEQTFSVKREFRGADIFKIRQQAFDFFQSVIDVMLESKGLTYQDDNQAHRDLKEFFNSGIKDENKKFKGLFTDRDLDKCMAISFCKTNENVYITKTGLEIHENPKAIRFFGYQQEQLQKMVARNLIEEGFYLRSLL